MTLPTKLLCALLALGLAFGGGWYLARTQTGNDRTQTAVTTTKRTITRITQTDGAIKETTREIQMTPSVVPNVSPYRLDYSLGLSVGTDFSTFPPRPSYTVHGGYRLLGNLWLTGSYGWTSHEAAIGVRVDF